MKEFKQNLKLLWPYAKSEKKNLIKYIVILIINMILTIIIPILSSQIIIKLTNNLLMELLGMALIIFIIEMIFNFTKYHKTMCSAKVRRGTYVNIQKDLGKNILSLENKVLDEKSTGTFIQRMTSDTTELSFIFTELINSSNELLTEIGIYIAIFFLSKIVFIYLIITSIILLIVEKIKVNKGNKQDKIFRNKNEKTSGLLAELIRGIRDIKMLNAEKSFMEEFEQSVSTTNIERHKLQSIYRKYMFISNLLRNILHCILIFLLAYLIHKDYLTGAVALVIYNYSDNIGWATYFIGDILKEIKSFNLSCSRIFDVIKGKDFKKETFGTKHLPRINGDFEFKNVSFSYNKNKVLKDLSFKVNANETVAFVGKSGVGKTTIFNLLCKMYEPAKGVITIDGINIKKLDKDTIRGNITIISQNPYIFNMTIRENLEIVKENLTEEEMIEACKRSCLHEFIMSLKDKYDTVIGEGGLNLSGGERQRLAIARALIQKTEIILFDEATSALDNETQANIQNSIDNMKGEYTILIIAHRLSTIKNVDRIIFINDGKVESEGTHEYLLKTCKNYKHLYESEIK